MKREMTDAKGQHCLLWALCHDCEVTNCWDVAIEMLQYRKGYWQYICVFMILHVLKRSELEGKKGIKIQLISILISAYGQ